MSRDYSLPRRLLVSAVACALGAGCGAAVDVGRAESAVTARAVEATPAPGDRDATLPRCRAVAPAARPTSSASVAVEDVGVTGRVIVWADGAALCSDSLASLAESGLLPTGHAERSVALTSGAAASSDPMPADGSDGKLSSSDPMPASGNGGKASSSDPMPATGNGGKASSSDPMPATGNGGDVSSSDPMPATGNGAQVTASVGHMPASTDDKSHRLLHLHLN